MPTPFLAFLGPEETVDPRVFGVSPALRPSGPVVRRVLYLVALLRELTAEEEELLQSLLERAEPATGRSDTEASFYVVPRLGTVSPWASKATDLAQRIGIRNLRRLERGSLYVFRDMEAGRARSHVDRALRDRMTEDVLTSLAELGRLFEIPARRDLVRFLPADDPRLALAAGEKQLALHFDEAERVWLENLYRRLGRSPTDAELMTFAQINSEHCRHKHFRTPWRLPNDEVRTLFSYITETHDAHPGSVLVAYRDNAAVLSGRPSRLPWSDSAGGAYRFRPVLRHAVVKVETHNHPTAIEPFSGAATGGGGEIRDESATGRGARPGMGLVGFITSHLCLGRGAAAYGGRDEPWERRALAAPSRIATPLEIMLKGPLGASSYGNEFGRPTLAGFFRTLERPDPRRPELVRGFHKPVMLAGGSGHVTHASANKGRAQAGHILIVLGGPAYRIGIGGGSLSSVGGGRAEEELEYASVQRGNPEMERRAQEVLDALAGGDRANPIVAIHDVGAGGLANAVTELVSEAGLGAEIELAAIPSDDPTLSPMEIWCNEAQERYVLALDPAQLERFVSVASRERCPWAVIGRVTEEPRILLRSSEGEAAVDLPVAAFFPPPAASPRPLPPPLKALGLGVEERPGVTELPRLLESLLHHPAVADKAFLVTIHDRTVGGRSARDPLVGPRQVAVADVAVQADDLHGRRGRAMAVGERPTVAIHDPAAASRLALAEALLNLVSADVTGLSDVAISANWMAARGDPEEERALHEAVVALGAFARDLGIPIPVGKDSLSMEMVWKTDTGRHVVRSPVTLVVTAFAPVRDVGRTLDPCWSTGERSLVLLAPDSQFRLGASVFEDVVGTSLGTVPDVPSAAALRNLFTLVRRWARRGFLWSCHDRSDGGLAVSLLEMAFASGRGFDLLIPEGCDPYAFLFSEEPGIVLATDPARVAALLRDARRAGLFACRLGTTREDRRVTFMHSSASLFTGDVATLHRHWSRLSWTMRRVRDAEETADEEYEHALGVPLLEAVRVPQGLWSDPLPPRSPGRRRPRVGILREQGTNGHIELAAAFARAGFVAHDLPMEELHRRPRLLERMDVLAAAGGFSYGDVLGAGRGWAFSFVSDPVLRESLRRFLADPARLVLGVCNGCQMLTALAELGRGSTEQEDLVPGSRGWPRFLVNRSRRFEGRWVNLRVERGDSPWLRGMAGAVLPIPVAHGEGRAHFPSGEAGNDPRVVLRYADQWGRATQTYPANPNGSSDAAAGLVNDDGRILILMPHPERAFRTLQYSWHPAEWGDEAPWLRLFRNAHVHALAR